MSKISFSVDENSISFCETMEWSNAGLSEKEAQLIKGYIIQHTVVTANGLYFVLEEVNHRKNPGEEQHKIARITTNEETGRIELHSVSVSKSQAFDFSCFAGEWIENEPGGE